MHNPFTGFTKKKKKTSNIGPNVKEWAKDRQAFTEVTHFSPSINAISSFACRIISGSGDGINNTNVSAFLYWQSTLCDH